jgi:hypothetical protein
MNISELLLSGKYLEAKNLISEELNARALKLLDEIKVSYASTLFSEEFDASFKGKTEVDDAKEDEPSDDDEGHKSTTVSKDTDGDGDDDKNITVNIKEGVVPTAGKKPSKDQPGDGAAEMPSWKKKQRALMKMGKGATKTPTLPIVSEEQNGGNKGAAGSGAGKAHQKALMKKGKGAVKTPTLPIVKEAAEKKNLVELSQSVIASYRKKATRQLAGKLGEHGVHANRSTAGDARQDFNVIGKRKVGLKLAGKKLTEGQENIQELSKKTLGSYVKKASVNVGSNAYTAADSDKWKNSEMKARGKDAREKVRRRYNGIDRAVDKLTK